MELNAQNVRVLFVLKGLDHLAVCGGGGDFQPLAELPGGLMVGAEDIGVVFCGKPELGAKLPVRGEVDGVHNKKRIVLFREQRAERISVPVLFGKSGHILINSFLISFGPDILDQAPSSPDIERLAAQTKTNHRKQGSRVQQGHGLIILRSSEEMKDEGEFKKVPVRSLNRSQQACLLPKNRRRDIGPPEKDDAVRLIKDFLEFRRARVLLKEVVLGEFAAYFMELHPAQLVFFDILF